MKKYEEFVKINELLASSPADFKNVDKDDKDKEILRLGIIAELDAVSLYEQLAETAVSDKVKKVLLDVAKEEKTHVGEFQALLKELDPEYKEELKAGKEEVIKTTGEDEDEENEE
jgi:rubrerythrin